MKPCRKCGGTKRYKPSAGNALGPCVACRKQSSNAWRERNSERHAASTRAWQEKNPGRIAAARLVYEEKNQGRLAAARRSRHLRGKYGMLPEDVEEMRDRQRGCCAVCGMHFSKAPHIDHDHATGAVRALLCSACNHGLGRFRDDPATLRAAADYIETHRAQRVTSASTAA